MELRKINNPNFPYLSKKITYKNVTRSAIIIGCISILFSFSMEYLPNPLNLSDQKASWWENFFQNLGVGLITSVFLIFSYDYITMQDKNKRAEQFFKAITISLRRQIFLYREIYEKHTGKVVDSETDISTFFNEDFYKSIADFDLKTAYPINPPHDYGTEIVEEKKYLLNNLSNNLDKYFPFLNAETTGFINDIFCSEFNCVSDINITNNKLVSRYSNNFPMSFYTCVGNSNDEEPSYANPLKEYIDLVLELSKIHNEIIVNDKIKLK